MYLIYDLETTGLPLTESFNKFYPFIDNSKYDSSRIVQIAWKIVGKSPQFKAMQFRNYVIKRDGFNIRNSEFHGITNERSDSEGVNFAEVMKIFRKDLMECTTIVAHNLSFDYNVLLNHLHRYELNDMITELQDKDQFCTMINSVDVLKIPMRSNRYIKYKSPSLAELHMHYFNKSVDNAHDAYYDVEACANCMCKLLS